MRQNVFLCCLLLAGPALAAPSFEEDPLLYYNKVLYPQVKHVVPAFRWKKAAQLDPAWAAYTAGLSQTDLDSFHHLRDAVIHSHEYHAADEFMVRLPGSATADYYCHDFAWRPASGRMLHAGGTESNPANHPGKMQPQHVAEIMADPETYGWKELGGYQPLRPGDVVTYHLTELDSPSHSGLVESVRSDASGRVADENAVLLLSKDVNNAIFLHRLGVSGERNFFRDEYGAAGLRYWRRVEPDDEEADDEDEDEPWNGDFWFCGPPVITTTRDYLKVTPSGFTGQRDGKKTRVTWSSPPGGFRDGQSFTLSGEAQIDVGGPAANVAWRGSIVENAELDGRLGIYAGYRRRYQDGQRRWVKKGNAWSCSGKVTPGPTSGDTRSLELKLSCGGGAFYRVTWTYHRARLAR